MNQAKRMSRRRFLEGAALAAGTASTASCARHARGPGAERKRRPNVLWLVSDDHAYYVTGAYGNRIVRTPNLDRLAAGGMRFDRAYCNSPMCTPSRQSFLTGRYPQTVGVSTLMTPLPEPETTLAEMLKEAGYDTAAVGKMHFNSGLRHGFDLRVDRADHFRWLSRQTRRSLPEGIEVLPAWKPFRDPARVWLNGMYWPYAAYDGEMAGTWFADEAARYLATPRNDPFFLMVSLYEPHSPFHFPIEYRSRYDPSRMDVPEPGPEDDDQIPAIFRDLTREEKQHIIASCYTSTEFMDKNVGIVLDALERSGQADDTLVVYLGDNGYSLGHHGRFEKHTSYEESVRCPLFIRYPGHVGPGGSTEALVEFIDIVPTALDYCGAPTPHTVQGESLRRLLSGKTRRHRDHVFVGYAHNDEAMVCDERWKFVYQRGKRRRDDGYDPGRPLPGRTLKLFDLKNDPREMANLARHREHQKRVERYTALLAEHCRRTARRPGRLPRTDDPFEILEHCVQPDDVVPARRADGK